MFNGVDGAFHEVDMFNGVDGAFHEVDMFNYPVLSIKRET